MRMKEKLKEIIGDPQGLVEILSQDYFLRNELSTAISIAGLKEELLDNFIYDELSRLNDYCKDVWLKVDSLAFEKVRDFAVSSINEHGLTIDEICSVRRSEFGIAVVDESVEHLIEIARPCTMDKERPKIGGYTILDTVVVGKAEFAVGENINAPSLYGTWQRNIRNDEQSGSENWFWGHYLDSKDSAYADLEQRVHEEIEIAPPSIKEKMTIYNELSELGNKGDKARDIQRDR